MVWAFHAMDKQKEIYPEATERWRMALVFFANFIGAPIGVLLAFFNRKKHRALIEGNKAASSRY